MTKNQNRIITILGAIIFLLLFMINTRLYFRVDMSADKTNTLSSISQNLYREIDDIVRITYFVSDRLVSMHPLPEQIIGLLMEYSVYSRGKIQFTRKDPAKADMIREMESLGIKPQMVRMIEDNEIVTLEVYTGIVIEYLDKAEIIPTVFNYETLEYDVTTRILSLARGLKREIGIIVGDQTKDWQTDYVLLNSELRRSGYEIRLLIPGEEISSALSALFVLGGAGSFDEWTLYCIDYYIRSGGNVLFAQDSFSVDTLRAMKITPVEDHGLFAMIASYGVIILPALVQDKSSLQISYQGQGNSQDISTVPYPSWITIQEQNINAAHPVTSGLMDLNLYWASPLEFAPPSGVIAEILCSTTVDAWLQIRNFSINPLDPLPFEEEIAKTKGKKVLAVAVSGIFPSFFEGRPKPAREGVLSQLPEPPVVPAKARIIVLGDLDFAGALMEIGEGQAGNLGFLCRAADWFHNNEETINLRRAEPGRLDKISDANKRRTVMEFSRTFNIFVIPFLLLIFGLVITLWRKRKTGGPKIRGL